MKQKLINLVKYVGFVYILYYYIMSFAINILKIFVKPDAHLILFNSYAGRKFDDSPKVVFDHMVKDPRFKDYRFVWAFHDPTKFEVCGAKKIKVDSFRYFVTALKARVWITNSSVERGLNFKGKNTFYLNTWHGTPIKKMGSDIAKGNQAFATKSGNPFDAMNAQGEFEATVFSRVFHIPYERFLMVGLPRNDRLVNHTIDEREAIREELDIPVEKKVILYAPTYREYEKDENNGCVLTPPMNLKLWSEKLSEDYVLLFRAHYEVSRSMEIHEDGFLRDMTNYPSLEELMIAADILISDYSSIFFDFSVMDKPMYGFTYDYEKYATLRGMYFDIREYLPCADNEQDMLERILFGNTEEALRSTQNFRRIFVDYCGSAAEKTVDFLADRLGCVEGSKRV